MSEGDACGEAGNFTWPTTGPALKYYALQINDGIFAIATKSRNLGGSSNPPQQPHGAISKTQAHYQPRRSPDNDEDLDALAERIIGRSQVP